MRSSLRIFSFTWPVLCVLAVGCVKQPGGPVADDSRVAVSFVTLPVGTKAGAVTDGGESAVNSLDLLAFRRSTGVLDCYAHASGSGTTTVSARVTAGEALEWYLVANAPASAALSAVSSRPAFLQAKTPLLHTTSSTMVMHASGTATFARNGGGAPVEVDGIELVRYACKVSVGRISVPWLNAFDNPPSCFLDRAVLVNARGDCRWSGVPSAGAGELWYNRSEDAVPTGFLGRLLSWEGAETLSATPKACPVVLYAMPNASDGDATAEMAPWTPRRTRLCLRLVIDGVPQWYPMDLPAMEGNTHYVVSELAVKGPGTLRPDMRMERTNIEFKINIVPWGENTIDGVEFPMD